MSKNILFALLAATLAVSAGAQELTTGAPGGIVPAATPAGASDSDRPEPQNFGGSDYVAVDYAAIGWSPLADGEWSHFGSTGWSQRSGGSNIAICTDVHLPTGARWEGITTYTNDTDAANSITYNVYSVNMISSTGVLALTFTSGATPGIERIYRPFAAPITVENDRHSYSICVNSAGTTSATQFGGVTLWYKLQVAPAPATATFGDVPVGNPIHRFVEALAASGITGGCGGGNFCPDAPLTRGQMAIFLSAALGLHFPN